MSSYGVNRFCRDCLHDAGLRELAKADPAEALAPYGLTAVESADLIAGEVGQLFQSGSSGFLLSYLTRWQLFGLDVPTYAERMRAAR
ncbi:hypothetical protein acdb102_31580 [Acidothermaceae bacterium B102]|nr:hypothetical protein acdb102_31580 [Acidothermaceae bacterium B102]